MSLLQETNSKGWKIFHSYVDEKDKSKLEFLWKEVEALFESQNASQQFKELSIHKSSNNHSTILHISAYCKSIEFQQTLWKLLLQTFKNSEVLKELTVKKDKQNESFVHNLVIYNEANVIDWIFSHSKESLNYHQFLEILSTKGIYKRNLLQIAANKSKDIKIHQILWKTFQNSCGSAEFLEILTDIDEDCCNIFQIAAYYTTNCSEIQQFIKHFDPYGKTTLVLATVENTKDIVGLTWKEISEVIINKNFLNEEEKSGFQKCDKTIKNILQSQGVREEDKEVLEMRWISNKNSELSKLFEGHANLIDERKLSVKSFDDLRQFTSNDKLENNEILWQHLLKNYINSEDLLSLLSEPNREKNSYIHLLIGYNKPKIIEFTFNKLK
ncbi:unnamed protein product [Chironomus riparius]|uniref:Uncharacterized protein n=1 Tax=Chironomus riparius TaxID=315576 RepID=A0A9N9RKG4_9DIPT|nr:unnamed protein product [Chironomus riparius]